jgi:hypothetical protein
MLNYKYDMRDKKIIIPINMFDIRNINICQPIINNIKNGLFYKILYINNFITIKSFILYIQYTNNNEYEEMEHKLIVIENNILKMIRVINKTPIHSLVKQIKIINKYNYLQTNINYNESKNRITSHIDREKTNPKGGLTIKISGIWENDTNYGLIIKIEQI